MSADKLYRIEYWKDKFNEKGEFVSRTVGTAEDYTVRRIQFFYKPHYLQFDFYFDAESNDAVAEAKDEILYGKLQHAIAAAYDAGKSAKAAEIRSALGY